MSINAEMPIADLQDAVLGRNKRISRSAAMARISASGLANKEELLGQVLRDTHEPRHHRAVAAIELGRIASPDAERILLDCLTRVDSVFPEIVRALGKIGNEPVLQAIDRLQPPSSALGRRAATFAAALIAYRLNLPGHELPFPSRRDLVDLPQVNVHKINSGVADETTAREVLDGLGRSPYGVELEPTAMTRVNCGGEITVVCGNRKFAGPQFGRRIGGRPAIVALMASQSPETRRYSVSSLVFSQPLSDNVLGLTVWRPSAKIIMASEALLLEDRIDFELRAVKRPGATPVAISGRMAGGQLQITEAVASRTKRRDPQAISLE